MRSLDVFFHVATMGDFRQVAGYLAGVVDGSGLYDRARRLSICVVGEGSIEGIFGERWEVHYGGKLDSFEYPTLNLLRSCCIQDPDVFALYLHTKGVIDYKGSRRRCRDSWRRYLAFQSITRWRDCVSQLIEVDVVGSQRMLDGPRSRYYFAGNFWWARGEYIARLPEASPKAGDDHRRQHAEHWLLTGDPVYFEQHRLPEGFSIARDVYREDLYR